MGGSGASPYYGLIPLDGCTLFTMNRAAFDTGTRGFTRAHRPTRDGDLFLAVIECGCSDLALIGVTGPLTGHVLIGNADGFWGPNVSSAPDFLAWYERWLDHMAAGRDNRALALTSPRLHRRTAWHQRSDDKSPSFCGKRVGADATPGTPHLSTAASSPTVRKL